MEIPEKLRTLFSAQVEEQNGSYVVEVPGEEIDRGEIRGGDTYRVAILPSDAQSGSQRESETTEDESESDRRGATPPVEEGEERDVEIEDLGEQGDGITRVERGFVVIVPDTELGERVTVEITDVRENVAFAQVVERLSYYE